jgi:hypothetical protein
MKPGPFGLVGVDTAQGAILRFTISSEDDMI